MHVTSIDEVTGLCWTLGAPLWWDSPQYCPAYMSAYVVDELLAAVPSGTIVLTVAESNEVDYESVEFIATMLRQHLTEQAVAADQHWLNPEMEGQGASYAWPVAQLLGGVYQVWHESRSEEHTTELQSLMRISYAV